MSLTVPKFLGVAAERAHGRVAFYFCGRDVFLVPLGVFGTDDAGHAIPLGPVGTAGVLPLAHLTGLSGSFLDRSLLGPTARPCCKLPPLLSSVVASPPRSGRVRTPGAVAFGLKARSLSWRRLPERSDDRDIFTHWVQPRLLPPCLLLPTFHLLGLKPPLTSLPNLPRTSAGGNHRHERPHRCVFRRRPPFQGRREAGSSFHST